jgi:flavin-dependent dehydrogenase
VSTAGYDAIVVGAGPAGCIAALTLARVVLVSRSSTRRVGATRRAGT